MSARVEVRPNRVAGAVQHMKVRPGRSRARRAHPPVPFRRARRDHRRPGEVRGPRGTGRRPVAGRRRPIAPPMALETGSRLTERGLVVGMTLAVVLAIAAVLCIATTALRVTAEPSVERAAALAAVR
jgi:hypothetical protein